MTPLGVAIRLGRLFEFHVSALSRHPSRTLLGLPEPDLVIDVGANVGQFARLVRQRFPSARLVCVEPLPSAFATLQRWANTDGHAQAVNCAAGSEEGTLPMNVCVDYEVSSSLLATTETTEATYPATKRQDRIVVPVWPLDRILTDCGVIPTSRTLLKLDVQGFELQVLAGAPKTLGQIGALLTEVNLAPLYEGQADFAAIFEAMKVYGLEYAGNFDQSYDKEGAVVYLDALFRSKSSWVSRPGFTCEGAVG